MTSRSGPVSGNGAGPGRDVCVSSVGLRSPDRAVRRAARPWPGHPTAPRARRPRTVAPSRPPAPRCGRRPPSTRRPDAGGEGERRLRQRHAVRLAHRGDPPRPLDQLRRRRLVVVDGIAPAAGPATAARELKTPAMTTPTPRALGAGSRSSSAPCSSSVYRPAHIITSTSVSAHEPGQHRRLVHARADGTARRPGRAARSAPGTASSAASRQWSSGSCRYTMSTRSSPSRSRLASIERRTPSRLKSHTRRWLAGTSKPPASAGARLGRRHQQPPDLRRHDVLVARAVPQRGAEPALGQPEPVVRRGVEVADARLPRRVDQPRRTPRPSSPGTGCHPGPRRSPTR